MKFRLIISLLFIIQFCFAQNATFIKGYYVTTNNDSIQGYFDFEKLPYNTIFFSKENNAKNILQLDIKNLSKIIGDDGRKILVQPITSKGKDERIYITSIILGKINLFRGFSSNNEDIFFISCDDIPEIKRINKSDPLKFLNIYFKDCKNSEKITVFYETSSLQAAIRHFNKCYKPLEQNLEFKNNKNNNFAVSIGIGTNANIYFPSIKGWDGGNYKTQAAMNFGFIARFRLSNAISLSTGLSFYNKKFNSPKDSIEKIVYGPQPTQQVGYFYKAPISINYKTLEIPLEMTYRYYKLRKKNIPFLSFGFSIWFPSNVQKSNDFKEPYKIGNMPYSSTTFFFYPNLTSVLEKPNNSFTNFYSLFATLGTSKTFNKNAILELGLKYAYESERFNSVDIDVYTYFNYHLTPKLNDVNNNKLNLYNRMTTHRISVFLNYLFSFQKKNE